MHASEPWARFEPRRENIIKMLHAAQEEAGACSSVSDEALARIAEYLDIPLAEAAGVVSFYQSFSRRPRGRHVVRVCDSLSCRIGGSIGVYDRLCERLGVGRNGTTPDGEFTLEIVNCLGSCDTAPNVMIDDRLYERVTPEHVDELLDSVVGAGRVVS
ncbi:MAG: NAD(P)H-dependent oxidoreductase subunit E [Spirochaetota bacterium]